MARAFLSSSFSSLIARISFFSFMRRFWNQIFTYDNKHQSNVTKNGIAKWQVYCLPKSLFVFPR